MKKTKKYFLGADIGGTNTRMGLATKRNKTILIEFIKDFETKKIKNISDVIKETIKTAEAKTKNKIKIKKACLAVAGPIEQKGEYAKLTNAKLAIKLKQTKKETKIKILPLINDLESEAYSINTLHKKDIKKINNVKEEKNGTKIILSAGTGLGKATIIKEKKQKSQKILASESGNTDFPAETKEDFDLKEHIKKKTGRTPSYEDLISGPGIERIYEYLSKIKKTEKQNTTIKKEINKEKLKSIPILKYSKKDKMCRKTKNIFTKYLARYARNSAIESLPSGGIYISGGIVKGHPEILGKEFLKEFYNSKTHKNILRQIPIKLITNKNTPLIGACKKAAE